MADAQTTIDLIFNGVDRTGAATMAALDNARKFSGSVRDITEPIASFTVGAVKLEAGILAAGLAMTTFAVKTAGDFSQSFSQINTLFDASAEDTAKFKDAIFEYSSTSSKSFEDVSGAINAAIGQGVKWSEAIGVVSVAEKLAVATRSDLTSTTTTLVGTLNAYGMGTEQAGKLADMFFQTIKDGKVEMSELSKSFSMITPLAKTAGLSLEEIFSAIAVMTATGMPAGQAIEYLRSTIANIIKPSEMASKKAAELGIEFGAAALKTKGLVGMLEDMSKATKGNAGDMNILIGDMGGMVAASLLAEKGAKALKDELIAMSKSSGSVEAAFKIMLGSIDLVAQRVSNAFHAMTISLGAPLLEEFGGVADAIAKIFLAIGESAREGGLKTLVDYIESQMKRLESSIETVAKNLPAALARADFSSFKNGIDAVLGALSKLFGNIDLTSVDGLRIAIETVGAAFLGLSKYTAGVIESFKPLFDTLVAVGVGAKDVDMSFLQIAGGLGGIVTQLNMALPLFDVLIGLLAVKSGLGIVKELTGLAALLPALASGLGLVAQAGALGGAALGGWAIGSGIYEGISALITKITGSENTLGTWTYNMTHADEAAVMLGKSTKEVAASVDLAQQSFRKSEIAFQNSTEAIDTAQQSFRKTEIAAQGFASAQKDVSLYTLKTVPVYDALTGAITGYEQQLVKSAKGTIDLGAASSKTAGDVSKVAAETEKAKEAAKKWSEELAKMDFEKTLKLIDQQTKVWTTTIEANAKTTVASYESLGVTIKSTSDLMGTLFGQVKDFDQMDWSSVRRVEDQIDKENAARDKALQLQERLTNATIKQMEAQTNALNKGDGLIKVEGAGLQPHLEAFMWEILKTIQVRVNKDGLKMLLGT